MSTDKILFDRVSRSFPVRATLREHYGLPRPVSSYAAPTLVPA